MNFTKLVFNMIGVMPGEEFRVKNGEFDTYMLDENLSLFVDKGLGYGRSNYSIQHILNGKIKIIKIPKLTPREALAIEYGRACGFKWMARNKNGGLFYFEEKPYKKDSYWVSSSCSQICKIDNSFIKWEDEEPYFIGGIENG